MNAQHLPDIGGDIETEHHLIPVGWAAGDPPPTDRVETWTRRIFQESTYGPEEVHWTCRWASPDLTRAERDALRAKHYDFMWESARFRGVIVSIGEPL